MPGILAPRSPAPVPFRRATGAEQTGHRIPRSADKSDHKPILSTACHPEASGRLRGIPSSTGPTWDTSPFRAPCEIRGVTRPEPSARRATEPDGPAHGQVRTSPFTAEAVALREVKALQKIMKPPLGTRVEMGKRENTYLYPK
ncbi:hypothetical protein GCM10010405_15210 [Streptomyces macrosporus]|uniref:Uncharacterized protein n=1 Tax=Streptomyces macrosporus TaxID=44032 RepID=A0ABP5WQC2_9ACTN